MRTNRQDRIVITGMGCITPLGHDVDSTWKALVSGESAIKLLDPELRDYPYDVHVAAPVSDFSRDDLSAATGVEHKFIRTLHRSGQLGMWATAEALRQANLASEGSVRLQGVDLTRVGVSMGSGIAGGDRLVDIYRTMTRDVAEGDKRLPKPSESFPALPERVAAVISLSSGSKGPLQSVIGACATGNLNIINGARMIQLDEADLVIAGGAEGQITPLGIGIFDGMTALDRSTDPSEASRPFHADARGFVMGEGAGVLVMESEWHAKKRGAAILAVLAGYGQSSDAGHPTFLDPDGAARAMQRAIRNVENYQVAYINAHATGTAGDAQEIEAIAKVFAKERIAGISSIKGATGHTFGAAGAVEGIAAAMTLRTGIMPPNLKLDNPVPEATSWPIIVRATTVETINLVLNNSFGFGGINAAIALTRPEND